jgi:predicted SprT family Zn-dependent metalloprotease
MGKIKGKPNNKPSKYYIPEDVKATFGDWTILENVQRDNDPCFYYRVRCKCGYEGIRRASRVVNGKNKQCFECFSKNQIKQRELKKINKAIALLEESGYLVTERVNG